MQPIYINHRINKIADLSSVMPEQGVEIDLRSDLHSPGKLHLSHDPWIQGDDFEEWLKSFCARGIQGPVILNTKEDGLEQRILELLSLHGITNYFFLDTALPTLVRWTMREKRSCFAIRLSKHEPEECLRAFVGKAAWLWVDCFDGEPMDAKLLEKLRKDFKLCLVSPELQGCPPELISHFKKLFSVADAVCTKRPELWAQVKAD